MRKRLNRFLILGGSLFVIFLSLLTLLRVLPVAATPEDTDPLLNEFVFALEGDDTYEFIEIFGDPNVDYSDYTIILIEGDNNNTVDNSGLIDYFQQVGITNDEGYWTTGFLQIGTLENGTATLLLVRGFTGAAGEDLDTDDDGVLDSSPWDEVIDDVAVRDDDSEIDRTYGTVTLTASFDGFPGHPGGASRLPDATDTDTIGDWKRNDFDGEGLPGFIGTPEIGEAINTPGAENKEPTAVELIINEVDYDQPGTDTAEFIEIKNNSAITVNLYTYQIELVREQGQDYNSISLPPVHVGSGEYFVVCAGSEANTVHNCDYEFDGEIRNGSPNPNAVAVWFDNLLVDTVSYGGDVNPPYTEGSGVVPGDDDDGSDGISRIPDGLDTDDNNDDFEQTCLTPGFANTEATTACETILEPSLSLTLTSEPTTIPEPGGNVNFGVEVANTGFVSVTVTALEENVIGNLDGQGSCTLPIVLEPAAAASCQYTANISGSAGQEITRSVTVTGHDKIDVLATAMDDVVIAITEALEPSLGLTLTADPTSLPEPGGDVGFEVEVTNTGLISVTVTALEENVIGNLDERGSCALPFVLEPSATASCQYTANISGSGGQQLTRSVTATGNDANNEQAIATDEATVTVTAVNETEESYIYLPVTLKPFVFGEPNDNCATAYPVDLNQTNQFFPEDRDDWYVFNLASRASVEIELTNFVPAAGQFLVYSGDCIGRQQIFHNGAIAVHNDFDIGSLGAGTYYVYLINDGAFDDTNAYLLTVKTR